MEALISFAKNNWYDSETFLPDLETFTKEYFDVPIEFTDESDEDENYVSVYAYIDGTHNYFRFTRDNNGEPCIDIKLNELKWIAGFKNWPSPISNHDIEIQLKNILLDIAGKHPGVHHDYYYIED